MQLPLLSATFLALSILAACDDKPATDSAQPEVEDIDFDDDGYEAQVDCDDENEEVHPGATEVCDGVDNDCDGETDEEVETTYYQDADEDGCGDPAEPIDACEKPAGYVPSGSDCDDDDAEAYPGN